MQAQMTQPNNVSGMICGALENPGRSHIEKITALIAPQMADSKSKVPTQASKPTHSITMIAFVAPKPEADSW